MSFEENIDQFQLLEEKIDRLIELINSLKREKESFGEASRLQEEKIIALTQQVEGLNSGKDRAKQMIISLLEKIEGIEA